MNSVNLIPRSRRLARRRRTHLRRCAAGCAAYALALGAACAAGWGAWDERDPALRTRLTEVTGQIDRIESRIATARAETATARAELFAARTVAEQPDWSLLMRLLADRTGEDVVLRGLKLRPSAGPGEGTPSSPTAARPTPTVPAPPRAAAPAVAARPAAGGPPTLLLDVNGLARSQLAVSQFVLRLEQMGLFGRVTLRDTGREPYLSGEAVAFKIECSLEEADFNAPPPGAAVAPTATASGRVSSPARGSTRPPARRAVTPQRGDATATTGGDQ